MLESNKETLTVDHLKYAWRLVMARTTFLTNSKGGVPSTCQVRNVTG